MKVAELVKISKEMLKTLHECGMKIEDYVWVPLYSEYEEMKAMGLKMSYIVAVLAEKYEICERKVYKLLNRFLKEC